MINNNIIYIYLITIKNKNIDKKYENVKFYIKR